MSRAMINELQQKLIMIERCDVQKNLEKEMDSVIKELKNKHQQEISNLQQQVDFTTAKYNQKVKIFIFFFLRKQLLISAGFHINLVFTVPVIV